MASVTMRVSKKTHQAIRQLAGREDRPMQAVIETAIEEYRRRKFLEAANAAYAQCRKNPKQWRRMRKELAEWDATLSDGLEKG